MKKKVISLYAVILTKIQDKLMLRLILLCEESYRSDLLLNIVFTISLRSTVSVKRKINAIFIDFMFS